jgi:hypothetical protein
VEIRHVFYRRRSGVQTDVSKTSQTVGPSHQFSVLFAGWKFPRVIGLPVTSVAGHTLPVSVS